jgi:predicted kinase
LIEPARSYLDLAEQMLDAPPVRLIAIGGLSGTGKSSIARRLGGELGCAPGARILRSDVTRKTMAGKAPEERLPAASYTAEQGHLVYQRLTDLAASLLAQKHMVIVDAVLAQPDERLAIEAVAREAGVPFTGFWLQTSDTVRADRVSRRTMDASDADATIVMRQTKAGIAAPDDWKAISTDGSLDEAAACLLALAQAKS